MVHSIELLLEAETEDGIQQQWRRLADAGLPSEHRAVGRATVGHSSSSVSAVTPRRPHVTLIACTEIADAEVDAAGALAAEVLPLPVVLGAPMIFGSARAKRSGLILVRQVLASVELLQLQQQVMAACPPPVDRNFAAGHWAPHITLARRLAPEQVGEALRVLARAAKGSPPETEGRLTGCRYWRGDLKQARPLTADPGS